MILGCKSTYLESDDFLVGRDCCCTDWLRAAQKWVGWVRVAVDAVSRHNTNKQNKKYLKFGEPTTVKSDKKLLPIQDLSCEYFYVRF